MKRYKVQDEREMKAIKKAEYVVENGLETGDLHGFEFDGVWICNPHHDEQGYPLADPEAYYGELYVEWYNSL